jgi:hypothetical protein
MSPDDPCRDYTSPKMPIPSIIPDGILARFEAPHGATGMGTGVRSP